MNSDNNIQPILLLIDNSSSMEDFNRLKRVNNALHSFFFNRVSNKNACINIMTLAGRPKWVFNDLTFKNKAGYHTLSSSKQPSSLEKAFSLLDSTLDDIYSTDEAESLNEPVIVLITGPIDHSFDKCPEFDLLSSNDHFIRATRVVIGVSLSNKKSTFLHVFKGSNGKLFFETDFDLDDLICRSLVPSSEQYVTASDTLQISPDYEKISAPDFSKSNRIPLVGGGFVSLLDNQPFSRGGQGNLYRVVYKDRECVLKWYTSKSAIKDPDFKSNLVRLSYLDMEGFLLPIALTTDFDGSYGYLMDYVSKDSDYVLLSSMLYDDDIHYMTDKTEFLTPYVIADRFRNLHSRDECFKDINDNNIFVNVKRLDVKICDCDNIAPGYYHSTVRGKNGYIAPEVFLHKNSPDIYSDQFSLAVLFFRMFVGVDPFLGSSHIGTLDDESTRKIYAENPVFIFDEFDHSNRPIDQDVINRWNSVSPDIKKCFLRTFTDGLFDKTKRTSSDEWSKVLFDWGQQQLALNEEDMPVSRNFKAKKRFQPIFFIIDNSNSMSKFDRLKQVQKAFDNLFVEKMISVSDTIISVDLMLFSKECEWVFNDLTDVSTISNVPLSLGGLHTNFNLACKELDRRLNRDRVLQDAEHPNVPVIILLSDGSDPRRKYEEEMNLLSDNKWFKKAHKIAIGISIPSDKQNMLLDFVGGDAGFVHNIDDGFDLSEYIKAVTMTITQTATQEDYVSVKAKLRQLVI